MNDVPAYILAGGPSSRFGSDKARAKIAGKPLILRVAQCLVPVVSSITVVAERAGKYHDLGLRTIADSIPNLGPLGGLRTALEDHLALYAQEPPSGKDAHGWLLLSACDWADINPEWVTTLFSRCAAGLDAIVFRNEHWQPLLALYHTSILCRVNEQLAGSTRSMIALLETAQVELTAIPPDWDRALQINS